MLQLVLMAVMATGGVFAAYDINSPIVKVNAGILPTGALGGSATWANQGSLGGVFTVQGGTGITVSNATINGNANCRAVALPGSANNWFKLSVNPPTTSPIYGTTTVKPVYTVAVWVYTTNLSTGRNCCYTSFTQGNRGANFYYGNGMAAADHWTAGTSLGHPADAVWPTGAWHHLVISNNGTNEYLYVDGSTTPATSVTGTTAYFGAGPVQIGAALWTGGAQDLFNCQIGSLRIYDAACASSDVPTLQTDMVPEVPATTYTITATSATGGTISPTGTTILAPGLNQTYTITANVGYAIADVKVDNVSQGAIGTYTFTNVQANHTIDATFNAVPTATITASASTGGTITPAGTTSVNAGTSPVFTIWPVPGNYIVDVLVDGASIGAATSHTFTNISEGAHTIAATFASNGDLIAQYKFDETTGTVAADSSPNLLHASLIGGTTWAAGKYDNAINLGGANGYAVMPNGIVSGLGDFSIAAWVDLTASPVWGRIFDIGSGTGQYMFLTANCGSNLMRYAIKNGGGEQVVTASATLPTGSWEHVAVTRSGNTVTLYLNGVPCGSNTNITLKPSDMGVTTQSWIGRSQYTDPYLNGRVDDFRIYAKALATADIVEIMTGGVRTISGTVVDASSNPTSATIVLKQDGTVVQTINSPDGVFSFLTGPGVYTVEASRPYAKPVAPVDADATLGNVSGLSITLLDFKVTVQVSDSNGPLADAVVRLGGMGTLAKVTDSTGQVDMEVPAAGANELYVDAPGHGQHFETATYIAGTAQTIPVTLAAAVESGVFNGDFAYGDSGWTAFGSNTYWNWGGTERLGNGFPAANTDMYLFNATAGGGGALTFGTPHTRPGVTWPPLPHTYSYTGTIANLTESTLTDSGATWTTFNTGFNQWGDAVEVVGTDGKTRAYPIRSFDAATHTITLVAGATLLTDGLTVGSTYNVINEVVAWWYPGYAAPTADKRITVNPGYAYNFYFKMSSSQSQGQPSSALVWRDLSGAVVRRDVVDWTPGATMAESVPLVMVLPPVTAATVEPEFAIRDSGAFVEFFTKSGGIEMDDVIVDPVRVAPTTFTVTYNNNGSTGTQTDTTSYDSGATVTVIDAGTMAWSSHTFTGWNTMANGTGTSYSPGQTFSINADTTLYAQWRVNTSYENWALQIADPNKRGQADDADGDGQNNLMEFALNGNPSNGALNGKVYSQTGVVPGEYGGKKVLILTIAVRDGAGVFEGSQAVTALDAADGLKYTVQGGVNLNDWSGSVFPCDVPAGDWAPLDPGYHYQSFALTGTEGLPGKGFLRVKIEPYP